MADGLPSSVTRTVCPWNCTSKIFVSLRTNPQTGVAIPYSDAHGVINRGISTPVCALVRYDSAIYIFIKECYYDPRKPASYRHYRF